MSEDSIEYSLDERPEAKARGVVGEGLTVVMKSAKPVGEHVVRWILICLGILLFMFELDEWMNGKVFAFMRWIWTDLVGSHPTVSWFIGVLSYHFALRHRNRRVEDAHRTVRKAVETGAIVMDDAALAKIGIKFGTGQQKAPEKPNAPK